MAGSKSLEILRGDFAAQIGNAVRFAVTVVTRVASGLVSESQYGELFDKYVTHVGVWVKKEKVRNRVTGAYEDPDERMMTEVETLLGVKGDHAKQGQGEAVGGRFGRAR